MPRLRFLDLLGVFCALLSGASGKSLVELGTLYKETYDGHQAEQADGGRAVSD